MTTEEHRQANVGMRKLMATYKEAEDMINIGAYVKGANPDIDRAVARHDDIEQFLIQGVDEKFEWDEVFSRLMELSY